MSTHPNDRAPAPAPALLSPGAAAPNFALPSGPDTTTSLKEFRGRPVVLVFYPADWSPVCGDQMVLYNQVRPEFLKYEAEILGISVDGRAVQRCAVAGVSLRCHRSGENGAGRPMAGFPDRQTSDS